MKSPEILNHYSLASYNTFGLETCADTFFKLSHYNQLEQALSEIGRSERFLILGGGSNILFVGDFHGTVAHIELKGRDILGQDSNHMFLKLGAGENWHETVLFCIASGWAGIENLSLIPGTVGAAPIQNIGAYGVELKDVFHELEAVDLSNGSARVFQRKDCSFDYRDSVFKREKNRYLILSVTLKLSLEPRLTVSHAAVREYLERKQIDAPSVRDISAGVMDIRRRKLPDPAVLGNAGSFFKNPVVSVESYDELRETHPAIPGYRLSETTIKVPAGWLIEQAGWKEGHVGKPCGVHADQALVIINHGTASGQDILNLADDISCSVEDRFGLQLEREVQVIA